MHYKCRAVLRDIVHNLSIYKQKTM